MVKDTQAKKRKASVPADEVEKMKKAKKVAPDVAEPPKKRKAAEDASPVAVKKSKTPKSSAAETDSPKPAKKAKKASSKKEEVEIGSAEAEIEEEANESNDDEEEVPEVESEDDDQTEAFLKGFASDEEEVENPVTEVEVPVITKKMKKDAKKAAQTAADDKPGVVYIGRIPHGFYENEMRAYFKQFGTILALRLARNRKTGASKHIAWIKFESAAVAEIVAKTMDNYLLFNHILKVKLIADEQVPENLFVGANKRFKKVPWNKIVGRKLEQGATETVWAKRLEKEKTRRAEKAAKLQGQGIDYVFDSPAMKSVEGVAQKAITANGESDEPEEVKTIEAAPVEEPKTKKGKKAKKAKEIEAPIETTVVEVVEETEATEVPSEVPEKKLKKKKSKTVLTETTEVLPPADIAVKETKKGKKAKKDKKVAA